ncbi:MAG: hypothetical protein ACXWP0_01165 [Ktedonobacterales bacterium]
MLNAEQMIRYRAARAEGNSIASSRDIARGDYDRKRIDLDWDGCTSAEARVGDYDITVEIKQDCEASRKDHLPGEFSDEPEYRLLPWGGKRRYSRRYVLASALTEREREYREGNHEPSTRSDRDYARTSWSPFYTDYGIAGGTPKKPLYVNAKEDHDLMDWYWRHGYSKSDAYLKATQLQREAAAYASSDDLEYYDLHVIVTRVDDGSEIDEQWRGGFDVDGREPSWKAFAYVKEEAAVFVSDVLREIRRNIERAHNVEQPALF